MKKKILILGATGNQISLVKRSKEMGLYTITMDWDLNNPAHQYSDKSVLLSIDNKDEVLAYAKQAKVDGIITCASDIALDTVAYVCEKLNLNGPTVSSVNQTIYKDQFRQFQKENNFNMPDYHICDNEEDAINRFESLSGKYIIKPIDSSGSKGIKVINSDENKNDSTSVTRNAFKYSSSNTIIFERFLEGKDYTIEGFWKNNKIDFWVMTDKLLTPPPNRVPIGHVIPSKDTDEFNHLIEHIIEKYLTKLGVGNTPFDFDIKITPGGEVYVLEMSLRIGGNALPDIILNSTGYDIYKTTIAESIGIAIDEKKSKNQLVSGHLITTQNSGYLNKIPNFYELFPEKKDDIIDFSFDYKKGDYVNSFKNGSDRLGHFIITEKNRELLDSFYLKILDKLDLDIKEKDNV